MRGLAALFAASAAWTLAGLPTPRLPTSTLLSAAMARRAGGASVAGLVLGMASRSAALGVAAAVVATVVTTSVERRRAGRSREQLTRRWPDFLAAVRSGLATGATVPDATDHAAETLGGPFTIIGENLRTARTAGVPFATAIGVEADRLADPIADRVLGALRSAAEIGGVHVGEILASLASSVADEVRLRLAHDAATTEQRLTAAVALVAPWVLLALTVVTNPTAATAYRTPTGVSIIAFGAVATIVGHRLALRTMRLAQPKRVFE